MDDSEIGKRLYCRWTVASVQYDFELDSSVTSFKVYMGAIEAVKL